MARMRDRLDASVLVGVGAAFDFHAGLVPQAPVRMQRCGLEWLFRLVQEPRRLWRRYSELQPAFRGRLRRPVRSPPPAPLRPDRPMARSLGVEVDELPVELVGPVSDPEQPEVRAAAHDFRDRRIVARKVVAHDRTRCCR